MIKESIDQPASYSTTVITNQPIIQPVNTATNQPTNQSTSQSPNRPIGWSTHWCRQTKIVTNYRDKFIIVLGSYSSYTIKKRRKKKEKLSRKKRKKIKQKLKTFFISSHSPLPPSPCSALRRIEKSLLLPKEGLLPPRSLSTELLTASRLQEPPANQKRRPATAAVRVARFTFEKRNSLFNSTKNFTPV